MDCLAKPQTSGELTGAADFKRDLIARVRALGIRRSRSRPRVMPQVRPALQSVSAAPVRGAADTSFSRRSHEPVHLRKFPHIVPRAILIGSSTGGPQALAVVLGGIKRALPRVPVLITQHMPPSFTTILAEHLGRVAEAPCHEPVDGEPIRAGTIYVAPGGHHMKVEQTASGAVIRITDDPPVNFCKPAVDPLFNSALNVYGPALLAVVLTGMGSDGARGALAIADAGGAVIAQDEETSVVWGMPGATATSGACSAVLPLNEIAPQVVRTVTGSAL